MRIVDRKTFLSLPKGSLYQKYKPAITGSINIKDDNSGDNDWFYQAIDGVTSINCDNTTDMFVALQNAVDKGSHFDLDLDCCSRDGCYEEDQLFMIWEKKDIQMLIDRLQVAVNEANP